MPTDDFREPAGQDLQRSKAFYEAIGFRNEPKFSATTRRR